MLLGTPNSAVGENPPKLAEHLDDAEERLPRDPEAEARAEEYQRKVREEQRAQFQKLKYDAQAIYGLSRGPLGVRSPEKWAEILEKAGDEIGNGRFIVRCLGAESYLDYDTVAVLITFRQNLVADLEHAGAAEIMRIDAAVVAYFNMLTTQGWMGNISLVVERELFGQTPLNAIHGPTVGAALEEQLRRLAEIILPLQERSARMMLRSLEALSSRPMRRGRKQR